MLKVAGHCYPECLNDHHTMTQKEDPKLKFVYVPAVDGQIGVAQRSDQHCSSVLHRLG